MRCEVMLSHATSRDQWTSREMLSAAMPHRRAIPNRQIAVHSFVPSIEGEDLAITGTNSTHQYLRHVDSAYPPLPKQLCAGSHETGHTRARTRNGIVFGVQSSLPGSTSTSTRADIRAVLHASYLQTQLAQRADEVMERWIFRIDAASKSR